MLDAQSASSALIFAIAISLQSECGSVPFDQISNLGTPEGQKPRLNGATREPPTTVAVLNG
jgi:hypothetical protein